jgi:hypothetical protein
MIEHANKLQSVRTNLQLKQNVVEVHEVLERLRHGPMTQEMQAL